MTGDALLGLILAYLLLKLVALILAAGVVSVAARYFEGRWPWQ